MGTLGKHWKRSEETKNRQSLAMLGDKNPAKRPEVRAKMSVSQKERFENNPAWNKGLIGFRAGEVRGPRDEETKQKISIANKGNHHSPETEFKRGHNIGENNINWKGDEVKYRSLHSWIHRYKGKPSKCENCLKDNLSGHQIHWANISHNYKRELSDWIRLCVKCHKTYDKVQLMI